MRKWVPWFEKFGFEIWKIGIMKNWEMEIIGLGSYHKLLQGRNWLLGFLDLEKKTDVWKLRKSK